MRFGSGWRLIPESDYLADADSFQELRDRFAEGDESLDRLQEMDDELRRMIRNHQRRRLQIHRAQKTASGQDTMRNRTFEETEAVREARELLEEIVPATNELLEEIQELQSERRDLARHLNKNFVAVTTDGDAPDLTPPDEEAIRRRVGEPAGGRWEAAVPGGG